MRNEVAKLVEAKRRSNELSNATRVPALDDLIRDELSRAGELPERELGVDGQARADQLFLELVDA